MCCYVHLNCLAHWTAQRERRAKREKPSASPRTKQDRISRRISMGSCTPCKKRESRFLQGVQIQPDTALTRLKKQTLRRDSDSWCWVNSSTITLYLLRSLFMYVQTEGRLHKGNHLLMGPVHDRGNAYQCIAENKTRQNLKKNLNFIAVLAKCL